MDLRLTEEQLMIRRTFREFAQKEVKPLSKILDARTDPKECIDWDLVKKANDLGLRSMDLPPEWGGAGADLITRMIVQEELGAADMGFADLMRDHGQHFNAMNDEQRQRFLPDYLKDYRYFVGWAYTEPDHGTDHLMPSDDPSAAGETFAELRGDHYVINGTKCFISHGGVAKLYIINARTDRNLPIRQCEVNLIVPANTPGFSIGKVMDKMGRRLLMNAELVLEDVRVPVENKIDAGEFYPKFNGYVGFVICSQIVGLCRTAYEESLAYARERVQGGRPIIQHQNVALKIANMKVKLEACRALLWWHAWRTQARYDYDPQMWKLAKAFVNRMSVEIVHDAVDIHGGVGVDRELPIEKYLRDVYATLHGLGMPDISLLRGAPTLTTD